jgi:DNA-binding response OmpR family regulator
VNRYTLLVSEDSQRPRHSRPDTRPGVEALNLDHVHQRANYDGKPLGLSRMEFKLLVALTNDPHEPKATDELLRDVWGYASPGKTRTVAMTACRLRRKLTVAGAHGWIVAVRGVGYRLIDSVG